MEQVQPQNPIQGPNTHRFTFGQRPDYPRTATLPYQALTPIARQLPTEQIEYFHLGAEVRYAKPWTVPFENMTIRQIINRVTATWASEEGARSRGRRTTGFLHFTMGSSDAWKQTQSRAGIMPVA